MSISLLLKGVYPFCVHGSRREVISLCCHHQAKKPWTTCRTVLWGVPDNMLHVDFVRKLCIEAGRETICNAAVSVELRGWIYRPDWIRIKPKLMCCHWEENSARQTDAFNFSREILKKPGKPVHCLCLYTNL